MIKRTLLFITVMILFAGTVHAQQIVTHADVSVTSGCATVLAIPTRVGPANVPNRLCVDLSNTGSAAARCGDANTTSSQGAEIPGGTSKTFCVVSAITCCAESTTTTIAPTETTP